MAESKLFSLSQVSLHNSKKDCWLIIEGKVYDVTSFLDDHPGGEYVLLEASGGDATHEFQVVGHSSTAISMMTSYCIGAIEETNADISQTMLKEVGTSQRGELLMHENKASSSMVSLLPVSIIIGVVALGAWYFLNKQ